jgi:hypothetical protein
MIFFSLFIPFSTFAAILPLLTLFINGLPVAAWLTAAAFSQAAAAAYGRLTRDATVSRTAGDIRGAIIVTALSWGIGSLFASSLFPNASNIPCALLSFASWFWSLSIMRFFCGRKTFEDYTRRFTGEKLKAELGENPDLLASLERGLSPVRRACAIDIAVIVIAYLACGLAGRAVPFFMTAVGMAAAIGDAAALAWLAFLSGEHARAAEGVALGQGDKSLPVRAFLLSLAPAAFLALFFSSDSSIFPPRLLADFILWLNSLFSGLFRPVERTVVAMPEFAPLPGMELPPALREIAAASKPWPFWEHLWRALKFTLVGAVAVLFLWFMINPLLSRPRLSLGGVSFLTWLRLKIRSAFAEWVLYVRNGLSRTKGGGTAALDEEKARRLAGDILAPYGAEKRREIKKSATLFARLIVWGEGELKTAWKPVDAPGEYCARLAAALPGEEKRPAVVRCGSLFETALYSGRMLDPGEQKEFKRLVGEIIGPS